MVHVQAFRLIGSVVVDAVFSLSPANFLTYGNRRDIEVAIA